MSNAKLKEEMKSHGVRQWEVAEYLDIPETSFSKMLRRELKPDLALAAIEAVSTIAAQKDQAKIAGYAPITVNK